MTKTKDIQTLIKEHRRRLGISLETMARGLGVSSRTLFRWEKGEFEPSPLYRKELLAYIKKNS